MAPRRDRHRIRDYALVIEAVRAVEPLIRADEREQPVPGARLVRAIDAEVEAKVRAQIAADIEARSPSSGRISWATDGDAARIARGES